MMTRTICIAVLCGILFSGFEGVAESASPAPVDAHKYEHERSHEIHGSGHDNSRDHDESGDHDDHFCHCGVHAPALVSSIVTPVVPGSPVSTNRYSERYSSLHSPPLLRPPDC